MTSWLIAECVIPEWNNSTYQLLFHPLGATLDKLYSVQNPVIRFSCDQAFQLTFIFYQPDGTVYQIVTGSAHPNLVPNTLLGGKYELSAREIWKALTREQSEFLHQHTPQQGIAKVLSHLETTTGIINPSIDLSWCRSIKIQPQDAVVKCDVYDMKSKF